MIKPLPPREGVGKLRVFMDESGKTAGLPECNNQGKGIRAITNNCRCVKQAAVGFLGLLMAQSAASAES